MSMRELRALRSELRGGVNIFDPGCAGMAGSMAVLHGHRSGASPATHCSALSARLGPTHACLGPAASLPGLRRPKTQHLMRKYGLDAQAGAPQQAGVPPAGGPVQQQDPGQPRQAPEQHAQAQGQTGLRPQVRPALSRS